MSESESANGSVLSWEKPKRKESVKAWKSNQADGAPPGTYVPNMSEEDKLKWKAKLVGVKSGILQVEIRKSTRKGVQVLVIVSLDGFRDDVRSKGKDFNVHISCNGSAWFSFDEFQDLHKAVEEAQNYLLALR